MAENKTKPTTKSVPEFYTDLLEGLGKYKHGKGCLYINKLEDIDMHVLEELISTSIERLKAN